MSATLVGVVIITLVILFARETGHVLHQQPTAWTSDQTADCGVVLTGGPGRVREGFDLLAHHTIKKLIIAGVHPQAKLREIFPLWPYYGNLNAADVILERRSRTTYGNAQQTLPLVEALHCHDLIVVTSVLHMHRALKTFEAVLPEDFPVYGRAVISGSAKPSLVEISMEVLKSLFYSIFAY